MTVKRAPRTLNIEPVMVPKRKKNKNHNMDISENHTSNKIPIYESFNKLIR